MHFTKKLSTPEKVAGAVHDVTYEFGYQAIHTFQAAFTFTLGLLTHELVSKWSQKEWDDGTFISWLIFMILAFVLPKLKDFYVKCCGEKKVEGTYAQYDAVATSVRANGSGSAHHFYS